ncbi:hypothetical protein [Arthrobacter sp. SDTb3-6]|uniref:hypothetical protein n=1 Tax=Arthrobacter sp. SDTb3-6 TaxID=2713571 RepID=UPI00159D82C9|nr:hypothetical protein [Arthrobacter sp. SDTb3-6]NVM99927.1 hypothetical protein [Arthrobacter sp. SDTb3-6]
MTARDLLVRLRPGPLQTESMGANTLALAAARVAPMVVGFIFWALAALSLSPARLGLGSALVSAVLLSVQLALLGVGPATVSLLPGQHDGGRRLLSASLAAVAGSSLVVGAAVVLITRALGGATGAAWDSTAVVAVFLAASVLATLAYQLDHIAVAQASSHQALARSIVQGVVQLGALGIGLWAGDRGVLTLLYSVAAGALASVALGAAQQWHRGWRPVRFSGVEARLLVRHGLPNHALMLSDRAPGYLLPLVVTAAVSATATASWYMVWMLSTAVFFVPQSAGYSLQAKLAGQGAPGQGTPGDGSPGQGPGPGASVRALVRPALGLSIVLTAGAAVVLVAVGPVLLKFLGPVYANGWPLLLIMAPALLVGCVTQVYYGICRARHRLAEATAVAVVAAVIAVAPAAALATQRGLQGVSLVWLAGQVVAAGLAGWRLRVLTTPAGARPKSLPRTGLLRRRIRRLSYTSAHDFAPDQGSAVPTARGLRAAWRMHHSHWVAIRKRLVHAVARPTVAAARLVARPTVAAARLVARPTVAATRLATRQGTRLEGWLESWLAHARPGWTRRRGVTSSGLAVAAVAALAVGMWGMLHADVSKIGSLGAVTALPAPYFLALAAAVAGVVLSLARRRQHVWVLVVQLVVLIFLLHGLDPMIHGTPRLEASYRHLGITNFIGAGGQLDTKLDAYFSWPGFFAFLGMFSDSTGMNSLMLAATWAPPAVNLLLLPVLLAIARRLTGHWRATWAAVWMFYLTSWVGQDYLAPQAYAYIVGLTIIAGALTAFGGRAWKGTTRWWQRLTARMDPKYHRGPGLSRPVSVVLGLCLVLLMVALTAAHQLTPFALAAVLLGLMLTGQFRLRILPVVAVLLPIAWLVFVATPYLVGHMDVLFGSIGDVSQTVGVTQRVAGDPDHRIVITARLAESGLMWAAGAAGAWLLARRHRPWLAAAGAAGIPLLLVPLQPYGGELLLRVYLYSLPFAACLATVLLLPAHGRRPGLWRTLVVGAVGLVLAGTFLVTRYGNDALETFTPGELALVQRLDDVAPDGAVVIEAVHDTPWRSIKYATYKYRTLMPGKPTAFTPQLNCGYVQSVAGKAGAYLLVTQSQIESAQMLGIGPPNGVQKFLDSCQKLPGWTVIDKTPSGILLHIIGVPHAEVEISPRPGPSLVGYRYVSPGPGRVRAVAGVGVGDPGADWPGRGGGTVVLADSPRTPV